MKKIAVSIVIIYLFMMIFMAQAVFKSDILNITPMVIGVIFVLYADVLIVRESEVPVDKARVSEHFNHYYSNMKNTMKKRAELRHDFANHSQVLVELVDEGQNLDKNLVLSEIKTLLYENETMNFSDNDMINQIIMLKIEEIKNEFSNVSFDIELFGIKNNENFEFCYNIMVLFEVIKAEFSRDSSVEIKLYVKDRLENSIIIAYRVTNIDNGEKDGKKSYEFKLFKEIMTYSDGTVIYKNDGGKKIIAGWMEVERNV